MTAYSVAELAARVQGQVKGDGSLLISRVAGVRDAETGDLTFIANRKYAEDAKATKATAIVVPDDYAESVTAACIHVKDPDAAFAELALLFAPPAPSYAPGIHPSAVIASDAVVAPDAHIGPYAVIGAGALIGAGTVLVAHVFVGDGARIGAQVRLYSHVSVRDGVCLGDRVIVHSGAVIGSDGFGYTLGADGHRTKIAQIGIVEVGDDVEIGANVTIDRARFGRTRIGNRVKIDNLVHIAHNVVIHDDVVIIAQVGISGSVEVGANAILAGQVGIAGHLKIGARSVVGARAGVTKDVPPGIFVSDYPAMPHRKAAEQHANVARLPQLKQKVADLEARIKQLESTRQSG